MRNQPYDEKMVEYINNKYDDSFTFVKLYGGHAGSNNHKIIVNSEKYPNKDIVVSCTVKNDTEYYSDGYIGVKFEEETRSELNRIGKELFGNASYVRYSRNGSSCPENSSDNTSLAEYMAQKSSGISFEVITDFDIKNTSEEQITEQVKVALKDISALGVIYFVSDCSEVNDDNVYEKIADLKNSNSYIKYFYFITDGAGNITSMEWVNGNE